MKKALYGRATHIYQDISKIRKVSLLETAPGHQASLARQTHSKRITHTACSFPSPAKRATTQVSWTSRVWGQDVRHKRRDMMPEEDRQTCMF